MTPPRRRRERLRYRGDKIPSPLGMPTTAERLAVAEGLAALGRELSVAEHKVAIACAQLFSGHIISQDDIIARLEATVLELRRMAG